MANPTQIQIFRDHVPPSAFVNVLDQRIGKGLFPAHQNTYSFHHSTSSVRAHLNVEMQATNFQI